SMSAAPCNRKYRASANSSRPICSCSARILAATATWPRRNANAKTPNPNARAAAAPAGAGERAARAWNDDSRKEPEMNELVWTTYVPRRVYRTARRLEEACENAEGQLSPIGEAEWR